MSWGEMTSVERNRNALGNPGARLAEPTRKAFGQITGDSRKPADTLIRKRAIVLDMGEASREQGFRLNGCR
jgi:hypothetical protein